VDFRDGLYVLEKRKSFSAVENRTPYHPAMAFVFKLISYLCEITHLISRFLEFLSHLVSAVHV